jgi:putative RecB family exonuclease
LSLLAAIIVDVQLEVRDGSFNWEDGINTRIRGALRTTIETLPLPWEATTEGEWVAWQVAATKRTSVFIRKSLRLFAFGDSIPVAPFTALLNTSDAVKPSPGPGVQQTV